MGVVDVRPAFSRAPEKSEGCRYVQDRILKDAEDVDQMYKQKAKVSVDRYISPHILITDT
jgi:cytochrome P450/NADPH-cytochrome P450 reductase